MRLTSCLAVATLAVLTVPAHAQTSVNKTVTFELDRWWDLDVKEGPITLHRIRLERQGAGIKSRIQGANEFQLPVKLEIEYTNASSTDWEAACHVVWLDAAGEPIDGYTGSLELDEDKKFDRVGGYVTTGKYGLAHAKKLKIVLNIKPD